MTATATAPKTTTKTKGKKAKAKKAKVKNVAPHAISFKSLVANIIKDEANGPSLLKTARETGWISDGTYSSQMTEKEVEELREIYNKNAAAKKAETVAFDFPRMVSYAVTSIKTFNKKTELSARDIDVVVDTNLFLTLRKRHPKAKIFLAANDPKTSPIVFSEFGNVAFLSQMSEKE